MATSITRYIVNLSKERSSLWHVNGRWPSRKYLLDRSKDYYKGLFFAGKGDVIQFITVTRTCKDYIGFELISDKLILKRSFVL